MRTGAFSFTRREFAGRFGRICAGALLTGKRLLRGNDAVPLTWTAAPGAGAGVERRYRTDAQVVLLSIPVFHRAGVGDGAVIWRESSEGSGAVVRLLEFTGRSAPERAAGLNRFGFIQELSRAVEGKYSESIYFGLMTSSPEETAADARKALHSNAKDAWFTAIDAHIQGSGIETASARFLAPARTSPAERQSLMESAHQALPGAPRRKEELHPGEGVPRPFLHALADLLSQPNSAAERYTYNGRMYVLRVERASDAKAAAVFREQRLIPRTAAVTRITGSLRRESGDKPIEFRVWIEEGAARPLPLRIEYQPKSYLRLTFEAVA